MTVHPELGHIMCLKPVNTEKETIGLPVQLAILLKCNMLHLTLLQSFAFAINSFSDAFISSVSLCYHELAV